MSRMDRYREVLGKRFPPVLRRFLAKLPPDGWVGRSSELWDALEAVKKGIEFIPAPKALMTEIGHHGAILEAAGFAVQFRRTRSARLVAIVPIAKVNR